MRKKPYARTYVKSNPSLPNNPKTLNPHPNNPNLNNPKPLLHLRRMKSDKIHWGDWSLSFQRGTTFNFPSIVQRHNDSFSSLCHVFTNQYSAVWINKQYANVVLNPAAILDSFVPIVLRKPLSFKNPNNPSYTYEKFNPNPSNPNPNNPNPNMNKLTSAGQLGLRPLRNHQKGAIYYCHEPHQITKGSLVTNCPCRNQFLVIYCRHPLNYSVQRGDKIFINVAK